VFSNEDKEQLRITPGGPVGIGTKSPEATLDVAGTIKARSIQFDDGSVIESARAKDTAPSASGGAGGNLSGTNIITAINDPATTGVINDNRISATVGEAHLR
jgi:hypothetical protein